MIALLLLALQETYENKEHALRFTLPSADFTLRTKDFTFGWKGTLCEIASQDGLTGGVLVHYDSGMRVEKYADWREERWPLVEGVKNYKRVLEKKVEGKPKGQWLIREHRMDYRSDEFHYLQLYIADAKHNFEFAVWVPETTWDDEKASLYKLIESVAYGAESGDPGPGPDVEVKERRYINRALGVHVTAPEGFTVRSGDFQFGIQKTIAEFEADDTAAVLKMEELGMDVAAYAAAFEKRIEKMHEKFKRLSESKDDRGRVRHDYEGEKDGITIRYAVLFAVSEKRNFHLAVWTDATGWDKRKDGVEKMFAGLTFFPVETVLAPSPWKGFGKGSWVKHKESRENLVRGTGEPPDEIEVIYVLVEQDAESYTMRRDTVIRGKKTEGQPERVSLRQRKAAKAEEGEETITVPKGDFPCRWRKVTTDDGWIKTWTSDAVPLGIVKSQSMRGSWSTTIELVDFEKK